MLKKTFIKVLAAASLMCSLAAVPALAGPACLDAAYPACPVEGCEIAENHQHNQENYCGHSLNDGHDYHTACSRSGCDIQEYHEHDGQCYFGHCETASDCYTVSRSSANTSGARTGSHHGSGHHGGGHH